MTDEGRLRHPAYLGVREDKSEIGRVAGLKRARAADGVQARGRSSSGAAARAAYDAASMEAPGTAAIVDQLDALEKSRKDGRISLPGGDTLDVTNLQKVFWPDIGRTKGDLLRYYAKIAPLILPVVNDRPLVMKRLPNGVNAKAFYQHRAPEPVVPGVRIETLPNDDVPARLIGGSLRTLLYMAQLASISMDPWFSTMDDLDSADQVAIDLDPQPGATFDQILDVARWVHEVLERVNVRGYPKTSGAEGLHIFIPLPPHTPYEAGMLFCQIVATVVATRHPKEATVERKVKARRRGTVYVDYLQNILGKTLATGYSARASSFAGVSTPLEWKEIDDAIDPRDFTIRTAPERFATVGDVWARLRSAKPANLEAVFEKYMPSSAARRAESSTGSAGSSWC